MPFFPKMLVKLFRLALLYSSTSSYFDISRNELCYSLNSTQKLEQAKITTEPTNQKKRNHENNSNRFKKETHKIFKEETHCPKKEEKNELAMTSESSELYPHFSFTSSFLFHPNSPRTIFLKFLPKQIIYLSFPCGVSYYAKAGGSMEFL